MARTPEDSDVLTTFALLQTLLVSVEAIDGLLQELAEMAARLQVPALSCGITVEYDGHPLSVSSSDDWARRFDETQYQTGDGPCLQAMASGLAVHVPVMEDEKRWPDYVERALASGLCASLSLPLSVRGQSTGAINLYSRQPEQRFESDDRARAEVFAAQVSTALLLAIRQVGEVKTKSDLEAALTSRSVIDQAIGILMAQQRCSADEAFNLLRRHSQNNNLLLRDVARSLVERTGRGS